MWTSAQERAPFVLDDLTVVDVRTGAVPIPVPVLDAGQAGMRSIEHGTGLASRVRRRNRRCATRVCVLATGDVIRARGIADGQPHESIDDAKCAGVLHRLSRADVWETPTIALL